MCQNQKMGENTAIAHLFHSDKSGMDSAAHSRRGRATARETKCWIPNLVIQTSHFADVRGAAAVLAQRPATAGIAVPIG